MIGRWCFASVGRHGLLPLLAMTAACPAFAAWPGNPTVSLAVCTAIGDQAEVSSAGDGAGGILTVWRDTRSDTAIYVQRVIGSGSIAPGWPAGGLAMCQAANDRFAAAIVSDGSGGAIVVWTDARSPASGTKIYAHHALASGAVDPAWPTNGRLLAGVTGAQSFPVLVSDGAGGAIVAWNDQRGVSGDIYAQHVLADGTLDAAWPATGRAVVSNADDQWFPDIASDGAGGALLVWQDEHFSTNIRLFVHHLKTNGTLDPAWPAAGCVVCAAGDLREHARLVPDGAGGAIVSWQDGRSGTNYDVYAHHVRSTGTVDPGWPADGRALCLDPNDQLSPALAGDGAGGAIAVWEDSRSGASDIYLQRVLASGAVAPTWTANGVALCAASGYQVEPALVVDGNGNAVVVWEDHRNLTTDIYAGRVLANGALDASWAVDGVATCSESHDQFSPSAVPDGSGGVVTVWVDARGAGSSCDLYAQRVTSNGLVGGSVVGVPHAAIGSGLSLTVASPVRGDRVPVAFTLASGADARIELLDLAGRRIVAREVGLLGAGGHVLEVAEQGPLAAGIYFLRLSQQGSEVMTRVAVLK